MFMRHSNRYVIARTVSPFIGLATTIFMLLSLALPPHLLGDTSQEITSQREIQGQVVDAVTGDRISSVRIEVVGTDQRASTNGEGLFSVSVRSDAPVQMRFSHLAYADTVVVLELSALSPEGSIVVTVELVEEPVGLNPLRVGVARTRLTGDPTKAGEVAGSSHVVTREEIERSALVVDNIHDILRQVPGVNIQDEEGYGLRPNIGLRGTGTERSSKITLMEDGILIAPAPYAAPSAYYFPTAGRMEAIEVRKGSSQIRYGPNTVGGAINLVSTPLPVERAAWHLDVSGGSDGAVKTVGQLGGGQGRLSWLVESYRLSTDGFKKLEAGDNTGFELEDYVGKASYRLNEEPSHFESLELKLGFTDQDSRETYLGLTDADFARDPFARYPASQFDRIAARHMQLQLSHFRRFGLDTDLSTSLYRNNFERNWYKVQSVGGSGIGSVLRSPDSNAEKLDILRGTNSDPDALKVRANNRAYYGIGIQSTLTHGWSGLGADHEMALGVRLHKDQEDRFQHEDGFQMVGGRMVLTSAGAPGSQSNRISEADALSLFADDRIQFGRWTVSPGIRWEHIEYQREDFELDDPARTASPSLRTSSVNQLIPGLGVTWQPTPGVNLFTGIHRGFGSPGPSASDETRPERSTNYELGARVNRGALDFDMTGFFSDYDNILGAATLSSGDNGTGDLFNGGAAHIAGLELGLRYSLSALSSVGVQIPIDLTYTRSQGTFQSSFESGFEPWGTVVSGDELPYLPDHRFHVSIGPEAYHWAVRLTGSGSSATRTEAGQGPILSDGKTPGYVVLDLSASLSPEWLDAVLYFGIQNITDRVYNVARRPAGSRPGLPRSLVVGVRTHR